MYRLQVAVEEAVLVHVGKSRQDLDHDLFECVLRQRFLSAAAANANQKRKTKKGQSATNRGLGRPSPFHPRSYRSLTNW